jgi:hypothetical protein
MLPSMVKAEKFSDHPRTVKFNTAKPSARTGSLFSERKNAYKEVLSVWEKNEANVKSPCYPF